MPSDDEPTPAPPAAQDVTVYWRPGCFFCSSLRDSLDRLGFEARWVNIWEDPDAAATVRAAANGNETVPTVAVAGRMLVNPPAEQVVALARAAG